MMDDGDGDDAIIWAHIKCVYVCEVKSTPFNVQFTSNLKDALFV